MNEAASHKHLTPEGKEALRKTIRRLREALLAQLKEEAERVYRLSIPLDKAKLPEAKARRRQRLEGWIEEQSRAEGKKGKPPTGKQLVAIRDRYLEQAVKEAAHTLLNRLVILRLLEQAELVKPAVLSGGWKSQGYGEFQEFAPGLCAAREDDTKGYASLLGLVFDELSVDLPGVFGNVGLTGLFPIAAPTLRELVEALNEPALESAWGTIRRSGGFTSFGTTPSEKR